MGRIASEAMERAGSNITSDRDSWKQRECEKVAKQERDERRLKSSDWKGEKRTVTATAMSINPAAGTKMVGLS
jgi:hypothetical protein